MSCQPWYPAAALSAVILSCGAITDVSPASPSGTGGKPSIDAGAPGETGGQPVYHYGVQTTVGGKGGASAGGNAGTYVVPQTGGAPIYGIPIYGPKFDRPQSSSVSTGGGPASARVDTEGGAISKFAEPTPNGRY